MWSNMLFFIHHHHLVWQALLSRVHTALLRTNLLSWHLPFSVCVWVCVSGLAWLGSQVVRVYVSIHTLYICHNLFNFHFNKYDRKIVYEGECVLVVIDMRLEAQITYTSSPKYNMQRQQQNRRREIDIALKIQTANSYVTEAVTHSIPMEFLC